MRRGDRKPAWLLAGLLWALGTAGAQGVHGEQAQVQPPQVHTPGQAFPVQAPHAQTPPVQAPARMQTPLDRPRIGLVLAGGGAKGMAHLGVLSVLEELRVPVDVIVGTSMGAIVAGAYATGLSAQEMERHVRAADLPSILVDRPRSVRSQRSKELERRNVLGAEFGIGKDGIKLPTGAIVGQNIEIFLGDLAGAVSDIGSFDDLPIPYRAIATDIVNGQMVVLDRGDLISAMRASMAVPGVFSPVELDGRLLVDGGLVRNLPVDVARAMGADIVIAVNLSTTARSRESLQSALGITQQMVDLLIHANVERSLAELSERDVLIDTNVGSFSSANFREATSLIPVGEKAARAMAARLQALSLAPEEYAAFRAGQQARERRQFPVQSVRLDESSLGKVDPQAVREAFHIVPGTSDRQHVVEQFDALMATDDFEQVRYRFDDRNGRRELVVEPVAKSVGPNYLRFGVNLSSDLEGESAFNILADHRATWLNRRGLEWRNSLSLGETIGAATELYQPLDVRRRVFLAPFAFWRQEKSNIFIDEDAIASYRTRQLGLGLDLGINIGRSAELRLGYQWNEVSASREIGLPAFPDLKEDYGALRARLVVDTLDEWVFPTSGVFFEGEAMRAGKGLGGDLDFDKAFARLDLPLPLGKRHRATLGLRGGTAFGSDLPLTEVFALGGFLNLSGLQPRQILADRFVYGSVQYAYRLGASGSFADRLFLGASLEGADVGRRINALDDTDDTILAGSVYLAYDSAFGPLYFGVGAADQGSYALYLFLGRP